MLTNVGVYLDKIVASRIMPLNELAVRTDDHLNEYLATVNRKEYMTEEDRKKALDTHLESLYLPIGHEVNKMSFGEAIEALKKGKKVARWGWNGQGIYIELQRPDEHSKMTQPYIYMVTTGLVTDNPDAVKGLVPWVASQTDILAEDWRLV